MNIIPKIQLIIFRQQLIKQFTIIYKWGNNMENNIIIKKVVLPAFLTALGFLALDYIFGDVEGNIPLRFIRYLVVTHLMMYAIVRRNYIKNKN
jgi:hypothetical protein